VKLARPLAAGNSVKCPKCARSFRVPDEEELEPEEAINEERPLRHAKSVAPAKAGKRPVEAAEDEEAEEERPTRQRARRSAEDEDGRPARKLSKNKAQGMPVTLMAVLAVGAVLVVAAGAVGVYFLMRDPKPKVADGPKVERPKAKDELPKAKDELPKALVDWRGKEPAGAPPEAKPGLRVFVKGKLVRIVPLAQDVRDRTLEAWVTIANLDQRGTSVFSIDDGRER
jgi:hypothetical protein